MRYVAFILGLALAASLPRSGAAALPTGVTSPAVRIYPRDQEVALALSAAPAPLRAHAAVYVLTGNGFVKDRDGTNGFTCIVNRDAPHNEKPTCYDAVGSKYILPIDLRTGALLLKGTPIERIRAEILARFHDGTYRVAARPGVAYMLSDHNQDYDPQTGRTIIFPPHVMFYAPYLTNKDIGSAGDFAMGLPSIGYEGPLGFIIVPCGQYCGQPLGQHM